MYRFFSRYDSEVGDFARRFLSILKTARARAPSERRSSGMPDEHLLTAPITYGISIFCLLLFSYPITIRRLAVIGILLLRALPNVKILIVYNINGRLSTLKNGVRC